METVQTIRLIRTTLTRRGSGKDELSPVRIITQFWTETGDLEAEVDPTALLLTPEKRNEIRQNMEKLLGDDWRKAYDAFLSVF